MKSDTNPQLCDAPVMPSRQLPLFPLDPWGAEQAVALLERPCSGISRAMIGPLFPGDGDNPTDSTLRCLAVTQDGSFATALWITQAQLNDPKALWHQVTHKLAIARQRPMASANLGWRSTPEDCLKAWSAPSFWVPIPLHGDPIHRSVRAISKLQAIYEHGSESCLTDADRVRVEAQAQVAVGEQIVAGVRHVLNSLEPELCKALTQRPRLSLLMAHQLIDMAKLHSPTAVTYAFQALRTESLGVLHLITSGQPENDANQVREAIFSGDSLPDTFAILGIAKAGHRQSVCKPARLHEKVTEPEMSLSDLPISGRDWLIAMRLTKHVPLQGKEDWAEFSRLVEKLLSLNFQNNETAPKLFKWCVRTGYKKCCYWLEQLISQAMAFTLTARVLANIELAFDDAITLTLTLVQPPPVDSIFGADSNGYLDPENLYQLVIGVSHISGKSINELMGNIFSIHPGLPTEFQIPDVLTIHALSSIEQANSHGSEGDNCLQYRKCAMRYVAEGAALYGVRTASGVVGTIALRYDRTEDRPKVEVQEVMGVKNETLRIDQFDLCRLAQSFADSWNSVQHVDAWLAYEDRCAQWRHMAQFIAAQLSQ